MSGREESRSPELVVSSFWPGNCSSRPQASASMVGCRRLSGSSSIRMGLAPSSSSRLPRAWSSMAAMPAMASCRARLSALRSSTCKLPGLRSVMGRLTISRWLRGLCLMGARALK
ncbi:hypothetical protein D3C84_968280 [compost metagenome]